ncbi:MAG TPA: thioredoxin family protein [Pirellulaceae bacterium]|jgi:thioredoxin 1|nr:thioredoxin family protein [Pirellulaceae bacterium]
METRFAWIQPFLSGAGLLVAAALLVGGAGCDIRETRSGGSATTAASSVDLSGLPEEFVQTVSSSKPTVVDFYATWCGPCQEQKPHFAEVERQYGDVATFLTVDVDEVPEMWEVFELEGIPTIMIFRNGEPVETLIGMRTSDEIAAALTQHVK